MSFLPVFSKLDIPSFNQCLVYSHHSIILVHHAEILPQHVNQSFVYPVQQESSLLEIDSSKDRDFLEEGWHLRVETFEHSLLFFSDLLLGLLFHIRFFFA